MNTVTFIAVEEVHRILKKPEQRGARIKLDAIIGALSGFTFVRADNRQYNRAPAVPCNCGADALRYGVAIRNHSAAKKETLLICLACQGTTVKQFSEYPFIKEGSDEHKPTKEKQKVLG